MPKPKKSKELLVNVQKLYEQLERQSDFNSINQMYRTDKFVGTFLDLQEFTGKYGTTNRYTFTDDSGSTWSLLSSSTILSKVIVEIPTGTRCEVFKNEKGIWMILPYLD